MLGLFENTYEGFDGAVDEVYRTKKMSPIQVLEQFGSLPGFKGLGKTMEAALASAETRTGSVQKAYDDYDIIHVIYPRRDRDPIRRDAKNFLTAQPISLRTINTLFGSPGF